MGHNRLRNRKCKIMPRPKSDVTISLKGRDGKSIRLNLTEMLDGKWLVFRDGKKSQRMPHATSTDIADAVRTWIVGQKRM